MDYLLERMRAARPAEIRVVTRPDKTDVAAFARERGATVIEARPPSLAESFATGIGDAAPADVILMGFPDSIWEPVDGYERIVGLLDQGFEVALGLFKPREADLRRYETVVADAGGVVSQIDVTRAVPSSRWIWGCAAVRARTLEGLRSETEPGRLFDAMCADDLVAGVRLSESYVDMGTHDGLRYALEHVGNVSRPKFNGERAMAGHDLHRRDLRSRPVQRARARAASYDPRLGDRDDEPASRLAVDPLLLEDLVGEVPGQEQHVVRHRLEQRSPAARSAGRCPACSGPACAGWRRRRSRASRCRSRRCSAACCPWPRRRRRRSAAPSVFSSAEQAPQAALHLAGPGWRTSR